MSDPRADTTPASLGDLPIQPTGSGVVDMEIAYEQMRLAADDDGDGDTAPAVPTEMGADAADSEAHPS